MKRMKPISKNESKKLFIEDLEEPVIAGYATTLAIGEECGCGGDVITQAIGEDCKKFCDGVEEA